ncbi:MAG: hypothetical protein QOJ27_2587, partial [Sphingomonadales bacterium]|nr:hypothetical protein [Sphingomonadales bacterium]
MPTVAQAARSVLLAGEPAAKVR